MSLLKFAKRFKKPLPRHTDNDPYAFLREFNTLIVVDDSGSMGIYDLVLGMTRWDLARDALRTIAPICAKYDEDGVDIHFINNKKSYKNKKTAKEIMKVFERVNPEGGTPTGKRLKTLLDDYLIQYEIYPTKTKPINIIVITDGKAHDDVASVIQNTARRLDKHYACPWQVGIQFFQVGNDNDAKADLEKLDNELSGGEGLRDIVDTTPFMDETGGQVSGEEILKVVLGSVNRRLDNQPKKPHNLPGHIAT